MKNFFKAIWLGFLWYIPQPLCKHQMVRVGKDIKVFIYLGGLQVATVEKQ